MSKLNRKTINKYIKSESIEITDQELFNSSGYKDIISDIGKTLTKRYNGNFAVELYWDSSKDAEIAFTDNITNFINTANFITQSLSSFEEKNFSIIGLSCHEFGHQIITDFTLRAKWCKEFENGNIFPYYNSEDKDYIDMKEILEQNNTNASDILIDLGTIINNSLEDLYVDTYMINEYPGDCKKGIILNNKICYDKLPKFDNKRDDIFILCNMILGYCKNKSILYENYAECTEYVKLMKNIVPIIEYIFKKNDSEQRWPATNMILILLWPYIKKNS